MSNDSSQPNDQGNDQGNGQGNATAPEELAERIEEEGIVDQQGVILSDIEEATGESTSGG